MQYFFLPTQWFKLPYFNYDLVWHTDIVELTNWNILAVKVLQKIQNEILFNVCNFYLIEEKYNHFLKIHSRKIVAHEQNSWLMWLQGYSIKCQGYPVSSVNLISSAS